MTVQIAQELKKVLGTEDVAVIVDAKHMCVASRGIKDSSSSTITSSFHGKFMDASKRAELLKYIGG
jgi:GTP cyclohydrolase I